MPCSPSSAKASLGAHKNKFNAIIQFVLYTLNNMKNLLSRKKSPAYISKRFN